MFDSELATVLTSLALTSWFALGMVVLISLVAASGAVFKGARLQRHLPLLMLGIVGAATFAYGVVVIRMDAAKGRFVSAGNEAIAKEHLADSAAAIEHSAVCRRYEAAVHEVAEEIQRRRVLALLSPHDGMAFQDWLVVGIVSVAGLILGAGCSQWRRHAAHPNAYATLTWAAAATNVLLALWWFWDVSKFLVADQVIQSVRGG